MSYGLKITIFFPILLLMNICFTSAIPLMEAIFLQALLQRETHPTGLQHFRFFIAFCFRILPPNSTTYHDFLRVTPNPGKQLPASGAHRHAIKASKPSDKPIKKADEKGLFILIQPTGAKWWRFRYRFGG
jgi:hypothetical protein